MRLSWLREKLFRKRNSKANQGRTQRHQQKKSPEVRSNETFSGVEDCSELSDIDSLEEKCYQRSHDTSLENIDNVSARCAPNDLSFSVQGIRFIVEQKSEDGDSVGALSELSMGNMSYIFDLASQRKTRKQKLFAEAHDEALVLYEQAKNDGHGGMPFFLMLVGECEKTLELSTIDFFRLQDERLRVALNEEMERRQKALNPLGDSSLSYEVSDPSGRQAEPAENVLKEEEHSVSSAKAEEVSRKPNNSESLGSEQSTPKKRTKKLETKTGSSQGNQSICDGEPRVLKKKKSKPIITEPQGVDDFPCGKKSNPKKTRKKSNVEIEPIGDQPVGTYKKSASKKKAKESKMKAASLGDEKGTYDAEKRIQKKAKKSKSPKDSAPIDDSDPTTPKQRRKTSKTKKTQSLCDEELTCDDEKSTPKKMKKTKSKTKIES